MNNEKLENLETAIAHHEQQITELNDVVTSQYKKIDMLESRLNKLIAKINSSDNTQEVSGQNSGYNTALERPPHY